MHNLRVLETIECKFDNSDGLPLTATTFDTTTGEIICTLGPSAEMPIIELRRCHSWLNPRDTDSSLISAWDAPCPLPELEHDEVLSLHYFHDTQSMCLVLAGGDLILVRENPSPDQERIEIVGSIEVGISAAQWNWNGSSLALITRAGVFVLMSHTLEPVNEVVLQHDDLKLSKHVSVGWGKKETQFQGKRAKAIKDPTMPESVDAGESSPNDDGKTTMSWRGDGAYVAVNSNVSSNRRVIRIYNAEGVLDSVTEPVDGLESALSWRPYGNLITGIKRTLGGSPKLEVVFFERNGLRHGEFDLRLTLQEHSSIGATAALAWNCDSSILAISMLDRVQLWTMGNYHYYLKQEFRLKSPRVGWHLNNPFQLCTRNDLVLHSRTLAMHVDRGYMNPPFDYGLVAVIDGKNLKLTPLKHANIPPPMAFMEVNADENIIYCAMSRTCQRLAFLTHSYLYLCTLDMRSIHSKSGNSIRHTGGIHVTKKLLSMSPRPSQLVVQNDDMVLMLAPVQNVHKPRSFCHKYTWVNTNIETTDLKTQDFSVPLDTLQVSVDTAQGSVWGHTTQAIIPLPSKYDYVNALTGKSVATVASLPSTAQERHCTISLSRDLQLLVNGIAKANQVTSFAVTQSHIVYTTLNHLLKFVHLTDETDMIVPEDTPEIDERCRAIERGARLITVLPSTYAVVLQMPRGNLETVYPRILVLSGIRDHIGNLQYRKAFKACQTHQIDLNLLYDYDPILWKSHTHDFIDQLKNPGRVDDFIQKLKEEDVTRTLYRNTKKQEPKLNGLSVPPNPSSQPDKVNSICDTLINILQNKSSEYLQNIITAQVSKRPPDTLAALQLVSSLRQSSPEEADLAVAHLCFLTDTNRLFDAALSLYDLELTLLVAQNAQRDPREYMPFLQSLQTLSDLRRKYTIDNHLKKYVKAITSLHTMNEHEEVVGYAVKHHLYSTAEGFYKHDQPHLRSIVRHHAEYLASQSDHSAAAALYESLSDFASAYPLYSLAHQWRESLACACLVPLPSDQLQQLSRTLATTCAEESRDYRSAATIHLDYLAEPIVAAELLCKASYFAEATRILAMPSRNLADAIPRIVDPMLTKKFGEIIELTTDMRTQLASQVPRIEELRVKKAEDPLAFYGGDAAIGDMADIPDNISLAPTDASTLGGQSMFTKYGGGAGGSQASTKFAGTVASNVSRKTSRTKRREERKRARGKKGSVYEEEYLVASVNRLIERVNGAHEEARRLVSGLQRRALREQADKVQEIMTDIQAACEDAKRRVWLESAYKDSTQREPSMYNINGEGKPSGADGVFYDSQIELQDGKGTPPPVVNVWRGTK